MFSDARETNEVRNKVVRIYHPQRKHLHCHPTNKEIGKYWVIEFSPEATYKSPTMLWTSATSDSMARHSMKFANLDSATSYCEQMGWGYDVLYPQTRWYTKKSYADNFLWKGLPKEDVAYD